MWTHIGMFEKLVFLSEFFKAFITVYVFENFKRSLPLRIYRVKK